MALGGEPIRQGWFNGIDVSINEYRLLLAQYSDSLLKSHSSPMDMPNRLSI